MTKIRLGATEDFPDGELVSVDAEGTNVVVGREGESLCAARNRCPHMGLSLTSGPGGTSFEDGVVRCPWHNSRFELASGENLDWAVGFAGRDLPRWSRRVIAMGRTPAPLTTYPVTVEDGEVFVEI